MKYRYSWSALAVAAVLSSCGSDGTAPGISSSPTQETAQEKAKEATNDQAKESTAETPAPSADAAAPATPRPKKPKKLNGEKSSYQNIEFFALYHNRETRCIYNVTSNSPNKECDAESADLMHGLKDYYHNPLDSNREMEKTTTLPESYQCMVQQIAIFKAQLTKDNTFDDLRKTDRQFKIYFLMTYSGVGAHSLVVDLQDTTGATPKKYTPAIAPAIPKFIKDGDVKIDSLSKAMGNSGRMVFQCPLMVSKHEIEYLVNRGLGKRKNFVGNIN